MRLVTRAILVALVGLVCIELGLRVADWVRDRPAPFQASKKPQRYLPHPFIGYTLRPGIERWGINEDGFRGPSVTRRKDPGVFRIVCLGGSTTYNPNVSADETWSAELEALLNASDRTGAIERYEVVNAGVPGYTTVESLINFSLRMVEYEPDAVLVYHAMNDARLIQLDGFLPDYSHVRTSWQFPSTSGLELALLRHSRIFHALFGKRYRDPAKLGLHNLLFKPHGNRPTGPDGLPTPPDRMDVNEQGVDAYVRNLEHIVSVARNHGILPVLTTFASCPVLEKGPSASASYEPVLAAMNERVAELAAREALPLLDLAPSIHGRAELFVDYVHFNEHGTEAVAREMAKQAREQRLWGLD